MMARFHIINVDMRRYDIGTLLAPGVCNKSTFIYTTLYTFRLVFMHVTSRYTIFFSLVCACTTVVIIV